MYCVLPQSAHNSNPLPPSSPASLASPAYDGELLANGKPPMFPARNGGQVLANGHNGATGETAGLLRKFKKLNKPYLDSKSSL